MWNSFQRNMSNFFFLRFDKKKKLSWGGFVYQRVLALSHAHTHAQLKVKISLVETTQKKGQSLTFAVLLCNLCPLVNIFCLRSP